ncbi:hypothetical protein PIB30_092674, partial [Stylosanthes scabra]|nr:hypothetical protein [Stylosanthes scabra]
MVPLGQMKGSEGVFEMILEVALQSGCSIDNPEPVGSSYQALKYSSDLLTQAFPWTIAPQAYNMG